MRSSLVIRCGAVAALVVDSVNGFIASAGFRNRNRRFSEQHLGKAEIGSSILPFHPSDARASCQYLPELIAPDRGKPI
jgi:hypothetical protein